MGWELEDVEKPFAAQLQALGSVHAEGSLDDAATFGVNR
jgi:type I restriction enzyme, R subunit